MASMAVFSVLDASAKFVMHDVALPVAVFFRYGVATLLVLAYALATMGKAAFTTHHPWWQAMRGQLLLTSTFLNFVAMSQLQLAQTSAIMFTIPLWVCALSVPFLGEHVGIRRWLGVFAGFIGVLVIMRPGTSTFQWAMLASLAASLMGACYNLVTRKVGGRDDVITSLLYVSAVGAGLSLPFAAWHWQLPTGLSQWLPLLVMGVVGAAGHFMIIRAHKMANASTLAPFIYTQIIWMTLLGYAIFGNIPDHYTLLGAAIVVASSIYIFARERALGKPDAITMPAD